MIDPHAVKGDFPIFSQEWENPLIYLDNAASSQKPQSVIDAECLFYAKNYANVHRSPHRLGEVATNMFENARTKVARFIGAEPVELVITNGTTDSINLIAGIAAQQILKPGDIVLTSIAEHHSNIVPWQIACARSGAELRFVSLDDNGYIRPEQVSQIWDPRIKIFAFQHVSNVLGITHPVDKLCQLAKSKGAITVVDGAQATPHLKVDVKKLGCDFYAFSAHKMCGPTGIGALWSISENWQRYEPIYGGGEMIKSVTLTGAKWNDPPYKFEAGTPNIAGLVGWGAAVDYLNGLSMEAVHIYVETLTTYAAQQISKLDGVTIHGPISGKTGAVSFSLDDIHPHDIASILDMDNIAVRAGHHCTQPLMDWLNIPASTRASFYFYNNESDVEALIKSLHKVKRIFSNVA